MDEETLLRLLEIASGHSKITDNDAALAVLLNLVVPSPPAGTAVAALLPCLDGIPMQAVIAIDDMPLACPTEDFRGIMDQIIPTFLREYEKAGFVLAVARQGTYDVTEDDVRWVDPFRAACLEHGITAHGVWSLVIGAEPRRLDA